MGPDLAKDRLEDQRGVHLPLDQGAAGPAAHPHAAALGREDRRDPGAPAAQQRRGQRGGGVPDGEIRRSRVYPKPPPGDLASGRDLFEKVGCLACHRVGDDPRGIEGLVNASYRTYGPNLAGTGSKVELRLAVRVAARPQGSTGRRRTCRACVSLEAGGGGHHRLPDEPREPGLPGPRTARAGRRLARRDRPRVPARATPGQAGRGEARRHERPRAHAVPGRADHLPLRLLRLSHDPRLRDDDADRHRAVRAGIEARRSPGLRLRARATAPHPAGLAPPEAHGAAHLRSRQGQAPVGPPEDAQVPLRVRRGRRPRHRRALADEGEGPGARPSGSSPRTRGSWSAAVGSSGTPTAEAATSSETRAGPSGP